MPGPLRGNSTNAFLETSAGVFDDWEEYSVTSSLLEPSNSFAFTKPVPPSVDGKRDHSDKRRVQLGERIALRIASKRGMALQLRGRVLNVTTNSEHGTGSTTHVSGADHMRPIVNGDVMGGVNFSGTFADLIRQVLRPFGFVDDDILIDNAANRGFLVGKNVSYAEVPAPDAAGIPLIGETLFALVRSLPQDAPAYGARDITIENAYSVYSSVNGPVETSDGVDISRAIFAASVGESVDITIDVKPPPPRMITVKSLDTIPIGKARPHPGETVYGFLARHAVRFNLLIWGTADGKIVFGRPNYSQTPIYSFVCLEGAKGQARNNVESISRIRSIEHRPSEINVYGHSGGGDFAASPIHAAVYDADMQGLGIYQPITIHDTACRSRADADRRAQHELSMRRQTGDTIRVVVSEHASEDGSIYAIDTMADVQWEAEGIYGPMYVIRRTFTRSKHGGTHTTLDLVPPNSIVLGDPSE